MKNRNEDNVVFTTIQVFSEDFVEKKLQNHGIMKQSFHFHI
ncbi:MAG: hypothetical protein JWQ27_1317 [Ferruginibacter sp.]|nr:hypothetical protein [Ferruginibacter sp.]